MGTVRFILGRAATGKTGHVVDAIAALCRADPLGPPVYWLLPKQATFQAERRLTCTLGGFARVHVVDFGKLGQAVLDSCGDVGLPEVTPAGRRMVIGHLLRANRDRLKYYAAAAHRPGLAAELDATFAEFERAGLDAGTLDALVQTIDPAADPAADGLRSKLADVHLLLAAYAAYVREKLDPQKRLDLILGRVAGCPALPAATLFVDDFYDFTAYERKLLAAVAASVRRTEIAMLVDPDDLNPRSDLSVFHRTTRAYRSLGRALAERNVPAAPPLLLRGTRGRTPGLAAVEAGLFTPAAAGDAAVEFFDAPDARAEVDAVARQVRAAVTAGGLRFRDVGVLVRSLADYREIVDASFGEHSIPYFADHRRSAGHHPLLRMVRACLLVARGGWPHEAVMTLAKCGLVGLSDDQADELENYVLLHRLRGRPSWESAEPWHFRRRLTRDEDAADHRQAAADAMDGHRVMFVNALAPLLKLARGRPAPVRDVAAAVFQTLDAFDAPRTMSRWITAATDAERRAEHEQVWTELTELFDQMVDVIGDQPVSIADFLDVLDSGLEGFDVPLAPATVDQVLLGQVDRTRTPAVRLVFVLGLAEGTFPFARREELVLSDAERRTLRAKQVDLDDDTERQLLDERFLAYVAVTRPTHRLVVGRPLSTATGRPLNPSAYWLELQRLCPAAVVDHVPRTSAARPETIGTPRQLIDLLMRWVRTGPTAADDVSPALYQWLAQTKPDGTATDVMRFQAWRALSYANVTHLSAARAAELFPLPLQATVRQLEDVAACPFRHFARYGLALGQRESADLTGLDLNNAYHAVVENLTRELLAAKASWTDLTPAAAKALIAKHAADVGQQLRGELMLSTARNRYLLQHIERTLERAVASMAEVHRRGSFRPAHADVRFGRGGQLPPHTVTTPDHRTVHLSGRIDRVDLDATPAAFTVADYKLSSAALSLDQVYYGLSLQLLTYLLVVRDGGTALAGRPIVPAAAFLLGLVSSPASVHHPDDADPPDHPDFHLRHRPRGLIDDRAVDALDGGGGQPGASKVVAAFRNKGGGFGNRNKTDVADAAAFAAMLALVDRRLGEAADRAINGDVSVRPYMLGRLTPCPRCEFRTVCRFEPGVNAYRVLVPMKREDVLAKAAEAAAAAAGD